MRFTTFLSLIPLLSVSFALPGPDGSQLRLGSGAKAALNLAAGGLSRVGDSGAPRTATTWDWFDCGGPKDAIQIKSIEVKPDPPVPGEDLTIYASGTTTKLIAAGSYADVVVKLGYIKLLTKRFDVCEELDNANATLQCPIDPDNYKIEQTVALPEEIPRAKFLVNVLAFTQDDDPMACLTIVIDFLH